MTEPGVTGFAISVGGSAVGREVLNAVVEIVVDARLRLPDRLSLRLSDDDGTITSASTFSVGQAIKVTLGSSDEAAQGPVFDGQITTLAPHFRQGTIVLEVLALDRGFTLQRAPATTTYQSMSFGDIATKLGSSVGLSAGEISNGLTLPFVQQSNETPWEFLWRLARDVDYEVKVTGSKLNFRPAGGTSGDPVTLQLGDELMSFSPRVTGVQQVDSVEVRGWDPSSAKAIVASASPGDTQSTPGLSRSSVASSLGAGTAVIVDRPVADQAHANSLAKSLAAQIADSYVEGDGVADGNPKITPGARIKITAVPAPFAGTYAISGARHVMRKSSAYVTEFFISAREDRSLLGLAGVAGPARDVWGRGVVVGVVTNNDDPDKNGRVRVRYPTLDDSQEGWWARVVAPGAGASRGLLTLPEVGDEVLVIFQHEDERNPYVLGSVYNGTALPGELSMVDGSFGLYSDKQLLVTAKDKISFISDKETTVTSKADATITADGAGELSSKKALTLSSAEAATLKGGTTVELKAATSMKLDGGAQLEISASGQVTIKAPSISLQASGIVQISGAQVMLG